MAIFGRDGRMLLTRNPAWLLGWTRLTRKTPHVCVCAKINNTLNVLKHTRAHVKFTRPSRPTRQVRVFTRLSRLTRVFITRPSRQVLIN